MKRKRLPKMPCPVCGKDTDVIDSRPTTESRIRRRRRCVGPKCKERFTTYEVIDGNGDFDGLDAVIKTLRDIEDRARKAISKALEVMNSA